MILLTIFGMEGQEISKADLFKDKIYKNRFDRENFLEIMFFLCSPTIHISHSSSCTPKVKYCKTSSRVGNRLIRVQMTMTMTMMLIMLMMIMVVMSTSPTPNPISEASSAVSVTEETARPKQFSPT